MNPPTQVWSEDTVKDQGHDPLAVALANASLLSVGYLMLGRRRLALATGAGTLVLLVLLASVARSVWFEVVVLLWWAGLTGHGWLVAGGRTRRVAVRRQRLVALAVTVPVLLIVGLLRFDASRIEDDVAEARQQGDCAKASTAQERVWIGPRLADSPSTASGDTTADVCRRLKRARGHLVTGLTGDRGELKTGFDSLASVLATAPGHEQVVDTVLDRFLHGLPAKDPCDTVKVTDWLRERRTGHDELDRARSVVDRTAPTALLGCGDDLMDTDDWAKARSHYRHLLDRYPDHSLAAKAGKGVTRATQSIELAHVRKLVGEDWGTEPEYCSKPAKYSGASPYRKKGAARALFIGDDAYTGKLPGSWRTEDAARAVVVVCVGKKKYGPTVRTCPYENKTLIGSVTDVKFSKIAIPMKAYELRTGKLVADRDVLIGGKGCPARLKYTTYGPTDFGPPSEVYVKPSHSDILSGFRSLLRR